MARRAPGCQEQSVVGEIGSLIINDSTGVQVKRRGSAPEVKVHADLVRVAPDTFERLAPPQCLRKRRSCVGRIRFCADDADRADPIEFTDAAGSGI